MERITDKLRKLLALAERGCGGEAENAKRLLEAQLRRYGMTLEDLLNEGKKKRAFTLALLTCQVESVCRIFRIRKEMI